VIAPIFSGSAWPTVLTVSPGLGAIKDIRGSTAGRRSSGGIRAPPHFPRGVPGPAAERSVEAALVRETQNLRDLAQPQLWVSDITQRQSGAGLLEQIGEAGAFGKQRAANRGRTEVL